MKAELIRALVLAIIAIGAVFTVALVPVDEDADACKWKVDNVIVMVPDGCSQSIQTLARWYKGEPLAIDSMAAGTVETSMFGSIITDSAPAATAFATGHKSSDKFIGVAPDPATGTLSIYDAEDYEDDAYMPLATILEGAKLEGMATGLVATSTITHATPAAFGAHIHNRGMESSIMGHLVYNDIDVVMGGGGSYVNSARSDVLDDRGYEQIDTRTDLMALDEDTEKVWGMFASGAMQPDQDRQWMSGNDEPSLAEMTERAIEFLSNDKDGFFLVVEGSQVDWAGHANDPFYMVTDFIAFDDAVKVALDFAKKDKHTQVIAFPDHNTGGMSLGNYRSDSSYTKMSIEMMVDPVEAMKCTYNVLVNELNALNDDGTCTYDEVRAEFDYWWGVKPTDAQINEMGITVSSNVISGVDGYKISEVFCRIFTYIGWSTHGHVGDDVPLWVYGPKDIYGHVDNTELAEICADLMGFELKSVQKRLFNEVTDDNLEDWGIDYDSWGTENADATKDNIDDGDLVVYLDDYTIVMPLDKDILEVYKSNGDLKRTFDMKGLTVHVYKPTGDKVFISLYAILIMEWYD